MKLALNIGIIVGAGVATYLVGKKYWHVISKFS